MRYIQVLVFLVVVLPGKSASGNEIIDLSQGYTLENRFARYVFEPAGVKVIEFTPVRQTALANGK